MLGVRRTVCAAVKQAALDNFKLGVECGHPPCPMRIFHRLSKNVNCVIILRWLETVLWKPLSDTKLYQSGAGRFG